MTRAERDAFLAEQRTCRVATITHDGRPHVSPLWFLWDGESLWIYSLTRAQRWADLARRPEVAVVVDAGEDYAELRGVELRGRAEFVGEVPRTGEAHPELYRTEELFASKYHDRAQMVHDGHHAWIRVRPDREYTWDFRKLGDL